VFSCSVYTATNQLDFTIGVTSSIWPHEQNYAVGVYGLGLGSELSSGDCLRSRSLSPRAVIKVKPAFPGLSAASKRTSHEFLTTLRKNHSLNP
jgi:hypothetical protein